MQSETDDHRDSRPPARAANAAGDGMRTCANCGRTFGAAAQRCLYCGALKGRECPKCKTVAPTGAEICAACKSEIPDTVPNYVLLIIPKKQVTEEVPIGPAPAPRAKRPDWLLPAAASCAIALCLGAAFWFLRARSPRFNPPLRPSGPAVTAPAPLVELQKPQPIEVPAVQTPTETAPVTILNVQTEQRPPATPPPAPLDAVEALLKSASDYTFVRLGENVRPAGLNNLGQVVGAIETEDGSRAFLWTPGMGARVLPTLPPPYDKEARARAVSDTGWVTGTCAGERNEMIPFLWSASAGIRELPRLEGIQAPPAGVNDDGCVVGWAGRKTRQNSHAYLCTPESGIHDLGPEGNRRSSALEISSNGWIAGSAAPEGRAVMEMPVVWTPDRRMINLGTFGEMTAGSATSINDLNTVVGNLGEVKRVENSRIPYWRPFIWTERDGTRPLPFPSFDCTTTERISNAGAVLMEAYDIVFLEPLPPSESHRNRGPRISVEHRGCFLIENGALYRLPDFPEAFETRYVDLNDRGELAGYAKIAKPHSSDESTIGFLAMPNAANTSSQDTLAGNMVR